MKMRIEIIPKGEKCNRYSEPGEHEATIDFQLMFRGLKDNQDFNNVKYALTEAVTNTVRDFEKAFMLGRGD
jgi:hypothetical protein